MARPRLVVDTDIMVPALVSLPRPAGGPTTASSALLVAWRGGFCELVVSDEMLAEYERILSDPDFGVAPSTAKQWCSALRRVATVVTVLRSTPLLKIDPADDMVLKTALAGKADLLVTNNVRHFREVSTLPGGTADLRYRGVQVVGLTACWDDIKSRHPQVEARVRRSRRKL